jgi:hypothetical protein
LVRVYGASVAVVLASVWIPVAVVGAGEPGREEEGE